MSDQITRELIMQWAYSDFVIDLYESDDDGDAAIFQSKVMDIFGAKGLLELAADPACPSRWYFAELLSKFYLWIFRRRAGLPFHFSRFRGIMSKEDYRHKNMKREEDVYEVCLILDSVRSIEDAAIQSLYKQIFDFRKDQGDSDYKFYNACCSRLDLNLFKE